MSFFLYDLRNTLFGGILMNRVKNKELEYLSFRQREEQFVHHTYEEERYIYELIEAGDAEAIHLMQQKFTSNHNGILSNHPLKNAQYHFVVDSTLVARACISGGLPYQISYSLSDLYIQKADVCSTRDEINELHLEMLSDYMKRLYENNKKNIFSKPVQQCIDYIYSHLHEKITVQMLADEVKLNPSYLSTLFKKMMHCSISDYIRSQKLEKAKIMLKFSDDSFSDICNMLALGSQSHFSALIKADCGFTPQQYRNRYDEKEERK